MDFDLLPKGRNVSASLDAELLFGRSIDRPHDPSSWKIVRRNQREVSFRRLGPGRFSVLGCTWCGIQYFSGSADGVADDETRHRPNKTVRAMISIGQELRRIQFRYIPRRTEAAV